MRVNASQAFAGEALIWPPNLGWNQRPIGPSLRSPFTVSKGPFSWGIGVSLSEQRFRRYAETHDDPATGSLDASAMGSATRFRPVRLKAHIPTRPEHQVQRLLSKESGAR